jgi:single-strand DNA-binding protein
MGSMNKAIVIGNLGQDPEVRFTATGRPMSRFSVATDERWQDSKSGEEKERTEWHRVVVWGKPAESVGKYLAKGRQVCVEGRLQTRKWQDKEGKEHVTTEIVADHVTFLDNNKKRDEAAAPELGDEE